ncbi:DUF1365 domain-containing protein [Acinetobacter sp.]|uniref:DUF1365 domain-containing protein n=1 Tax=Acinetobacter sp. TaxID=472 RepID=UPI003890D04D
MLNISLAIADAKIRHRRYAPKAHSFESSLSYLWFDPDQLESITAKSWLWSCRRWNILNLYPADFLTAYQGTLRQKVQKALLQYTNTLLLPTWQIRILALPRCLGFRFNSVVFYFILDQDHQPLFILSEITNTPWNERQVYVHDCRDQAEIHGDFQDYEFDFGKSFHVSPFMPMEIDYRWRFNFSETLNVIHMQLFQQQQLIFDATLRFCLNSITFPSQLHRYAVMHSIEPFKMVVSIYVQALQLWWKKVPFYRHPKKEKDQ